MAKTRSQPTSPNKADAIVTVGPVARGLSPEQIEAIRPRSETIISGLGSRMAKIREKQKITQGDLAKRLGRSRATVNQYESGAIEPPLKMVGRLAEALDVDPALLAFGGVSNAPAPGERLHVLNDDADGGDYVELSLALSRRLRITSDSGQLLELQSDAAAFGLRRGDLIFLDTSATNLHGDGNLYMVRGGAGALAMVRSDFQLVEDVDRVRLTFGQGQVSEVDPKKVEVLGLVRASLRVE